MSQETIDYLIGSLLGGVSVIVIIFLSVLMIIYVTPKMPQNSNYNKDP